jgi:hypothetical protein
MPFGAPQVLAEHVVPGVPLNLSQLSNGEVLNTALTGEKLTARQGA